MVYCQRCLNTHRKNKLHWCQTNCGFLRGRWLVFFCKAFSLPVAWGDRTTTTKEITRAGPWSFAFGYGRVFLHEEVKATRAGKWSAGSSALIFSARPPENLSLTFLKSSRGRTDARPAVPIRKLRLCLRPFLSQRQSYYYWITVRCVKNVLPHILLWKDTRKTWTITLGKWAHYSLF